MTGLIDVHAHLLFDELLGLAGRAGPRLEHDATGVATLVTGNYRFAIGRTTSVNRDPEQRINELDAAGIDVQVVSGSPLWYFPHLDVAVTQPFAVTYNDLLARWCQAEPRRLKALAMLPVQDIAAAVSELRRAVMELGFVGASIGTDARTDLDNPELDPLYSACEDLDVPLFIHSTVAGLDGPPGDLRLRRWLRDVTLGYPFEETIAVTSLVLGGVLERHPQLDICLSHGGGAMPFLLGRVRAWVATGAAPLDVEAFDRSYARLWFDTHVHSEQSTGLLTDVADPNHLVFGTNMGGWDSAGGHDDVPPDHALNARRLLRLS